MRSRTVALFLAASFMVAEGCSKHSVPTAPRADGVEHSPGRFRAAGFVAVIDNPYLPLTPGTVFVYQGLKDGLPETNRVYVSRKKKIILGVTCTTVLDTSLVAGRLQEATEDWYAQDENGTVWYFGEDSKEFLDGGVVSSEGSWQAGVDGARQGIIMQADPEVGSTYYQEFLIDVAEDQARVLALNASANVPYGRFSGCLKTREWTRLDPGVTEDKFYARGIGNVRAVTRQGGSDFSELVSVGTE